MDNSLERRINIARCWASSRIALLDSVERYEDSYAITEEFREWITCLETHSKRLNSSILKCPESFRDSFENSDEVVEL